MSSTRKDSVLGQQERRRLRELAISDTGFVFDPATGSTYSVNETGRLVLQALGEGMDLQTVAAVIARTHDTTGKDLERDITAFCRLLRTHQLLPAEQPTTRSE